MRRVLVVAHTGRDAAVEARDAVVHALTARGIEVLHEDALTQDVPPGVEVALVLGGDGTILRTAELVFGTGIPILGVNLGHIGFLAESEVSELDEVVEKVAERTYHVEERMTIEVSVTLPDGTTAHGWAMNEVTVEKASRERMIEVALGVDGRALSSFGCDGVVVATPSGSTAYAFSGGGPVVWPDVEALLVVPLAAHALFSRPLVLGPRSVLEIELLTRTVTSSVMWCDGRRLLDLPAGSHIEVTRGSAVVRLARLKTAPFSSRLVRKFDLTVEGWRGAGAP